MQQLENELEKVRNRLYAAEEEASKPPPLLLQLQEEMDAMKVLLVSSAAYGAGLAIKNARQCRLIYGFGKAFCSYFLFLVAVLIM